jgi:hypothetical protein
MVRASLRMRSLARAESCNCVIAASHLLTLIKSLRSLQARTEICEGFQARKWYAFHLIGSAHCTATNLAVTGIWGGDKLLVRLDKIVLALF